MKQIIIVRKDLGMSSGKMAAQVSHASMAFLSNMIRKNSHRFISNCYLSYDGDGNRVSFKNPDLQRFSEKAEKEGDGFFYARPVDENDPNGKMELCDPDISYKCRMMIDKELYEDWLGGIFTKIICEAKNKNQLMKAVTMAEELGFREGEDYFLIKDACLTELTPEETDESGAGRCLTCIGFKPLPDDVAAKISRKYQLYR